MYVFIFIYLLNNKIVKIQFLLFYYVLKMDFLVIFVMQDLFIIEFLLFDLYLFWWLNFLGNIIENYVLDIVNIIEGRV